MKASEGVLERLNAILTHELTIINQYFIHAKMCQRWGFAGLAARLRRDSIEAMRDAEEITERILQLEGVPNYQRLGSVKVGQTVTEQIRLALESERGAAETLRDAVAHCGRVADPDTQHLLTEMLEDRTEQIAWLETQLELISQIGPQNYLRAKIAEE